jgi:hypothetical protein
MRRAIPDVMRLRTLFLVALTLGGSSAGCTSCAQSYLGIMPGAINDPANRTLRREILSYGIGQFCTELQKHSAPLKLADDQPAIGRFFPKTCTAKALQNGDLLVSLTGDGYGWTNLSKKVTFEMSGTIEYDQDFQLDGSTMYAYFRTKQITKSDFKSRAIENPLANIVNSLSSVGDNFAKQLLAAELQKGFTVIREKDGNADFGLGVIDTGKKPLRPWSVHGVSRITYENTRSEIHQNQRDFIGPIYVEDDGRAIWVTARLDGVDAADMLVLNKADGEASVASYITNGTAGALAGTPVFSDVIQNGVQWSKPIVLAKGVYYLIFDNSATAGRVAPAVNLLDDKAATFTYVVQIGDAP